MSGLAFYDLDGTLVSSNIVLRYAFYARSLPSKRRAVLKCSKLLVSVPVLIALDFYSRRVFNEVFFREYRGLRKQWLEQLAETVFQKVIRPSIYPGAKALVAADRERGFRPILVTGELDFIAAPVARYFGFDGLVSNSLVFKNGAATGEVVPPLVAETEKVAVITKLCRERNVAAAQSKAYSDSYSDLPMLEAVGNPVAVNPDRRLRRIAFRRGWPIRDLKRGNHVHLPRESPSGRVAGF